MLNLLNIIVGLLFRMFCLSVKEKDDWDDIEDWKAMVGLILEMLVIYGIYREYKRPRPEPEILLKKDGTPRKKLSEVNDDDDLYQWLMDNYCEPGKGFPPGVTYDEYYAMLKRLHRSRKGKPEHGGRYDNVDDELN